MIIQPTELEYKPLFDFAHQCISLCTEHFTHQENLGKASLTIYEDNMLSILISEDNLVNISYMSSGNNSHYEHLMTFYNHCIIMIKGMEEISYLFDYPEKMIEKISLNKKLEEKLLDNKKLASSKKV